MLQIFIYILTITHLQTLLSKSIVWAVLTQVLILERQMLVRRNQVYSRPALKRIQGLAPQRSLILRLRGVKDFYEEGRRQRAVGWAGSWSTSVEWVCLFKDILVGSNLLQST